MRVDVAEEFKQIEKETILMQLKDEKLFYLENDI